jgi:hypothetical protein
MNSKGQMVYVPHDALNEVFEVMRNEDRSRPDAFRIVAKRAKRYKNSIAVM